MKITYTLSGIDAAARKIIDRAATKTLLFYGEMGVGKTTLIKAIVKQLGITETTGSPTFGLVNEYGEADKVYHFDFYRIKDESEAYDMGFEEYFLAGAWICIEWPEKIAHLLPDNHTALYLTVEKDNSRTLLMENKLI
ncbi:MAG: tRNA (adenosine(37)-N6)-threonylcarbamoyltransferase complex ATPase subunit type 1 TsaE [Sinomicrobium sp.]|nr:tRNA (adenosine(37)-N6)-threonylcarbamoyltransferase complex ATPase subunit type 1 TsaE [Sinomicrobium sp.]